jgi:plastocyanin
MDQSRLPPMPVPTKVTNADRHFSFVLLILSLAAAGVARAADTNTGTVTGRIRYQPDTARPWSLSRYYLNNGFLAEAVVALEGAGLTAPAVTPATVWVDQKNFQFVPETVAIRAGDSVRFTNSDEALHNVMTFQGAAPMNVNLPQGHEHVHLFPEGKGFDQQIQLTCVYHGAMRGWVYVFPHPFFGLTGKDGQFRFENVPAGTYRLRVVHAAGELEWSQSVTVKKGEPVEISIALGPDQKKK